MLSCSGHGWCAGCEKSAALPQHSPSQRSPGHGPRTPWHSPHPPNTRQNPHEPNIPTADACPVFSAPRNLSVAHTGPNQLKLHRQPPPEVLPPEIDSLASVQALLQAFEQASGWSLRYFSGSESRSSNDLRWSAPVNPGVGTTPGHLRLDPIDSDSATRPAVDQEAARLMAGAVAGLLGDLLAARHALWQREADLAAGVPLIPDPEEHQHLAARLEAVLRGGAEAVGCHAAALYMLDEATTELKLRSAWGLPFDRLTAPARPLKGEAADLEAMLGHAVVLTEPKLIEHWRAPEQFPAAVCIPVSTATTILGTFWVFCRRKRDFSDRQTNVLEVVAGRLAAELEREMMLREALDGAQLRRQMAAAERFQRNQLPAISPMLDGWQMAGWTAQAGSVGGDFYDWICPGDGLVAAMVGDAHGRSVEAMMTACVLRTALRSHVLYHRQSERVLQRANLTLWTGSAGDQQAAAFCGLVQTATGRVCYATAGRPSVILVRPGGWDSLTRTSPLLGTSPESEFYTAGCELPPGHALVIFSEGARETRDARGLPLGEPPVAEAILRQRNLGADRLVSVVRDLVAAHSTGPATDDRTVLIIKRTAP